MAAYTFTQIIDALAAVIQGALTAISDTGVVLTDRRTVEEDAEVLTLVQALHPTGEAHAWLITLMRISEADTPNPCEVEQTLGYTLEALFPYQRKRADDSTSESGFRAMLEAVFEAVRGSRNLGLDNRIFHKLIQTEDNFSIMNWGGVGSDALLTHYSRLRIDVIHSIRA